MSKRFLKALENTSASRYPASRAISLTGLSVVFKKITVFAVFVSVFPVLACAEGGIKDIIKMALETILLSPLGTAGSITVYVIPLILIRLDTVNEPLYAFIFCFFGCAILGMTVTKLLMKPIDRVLSLHKRTERI